MYRKLALVAMAAFGLTGVAAAQSLNAAGASFPDPIYEKWFQEIKSAKGVQINYQPTGSGAGISQLQAGTVDFGASDAPMTDDELSKSKIKPLHFPTVLGAVVVTYNLPSIKTDLKMNADVIAKIFMVQIKKWNDPAIAKLNPGVKLPAADIVVCHRADSSGTTFIFTDYLSKASPDWEKNMGKGSKTPKWHGGTMGQAQNQGVAGFVKQTEGAIGYVELGYVLENHMQSALVQNSAGDFVKAGLDTVSGAAAGAASTMPADFRMSITNGPGKNAYPISSFTYLLIPSKIPDGKKKAAIVDFLNWMLTTGQKDCAGLGYAPLPKEIVAKETKQISQIQ